MHVHGEASEQTGRILQVSVIVTVLYVLLTFGAGLRAHSLALISEAGHNISDAGALLLSFVAVYFQGRPATDRKTFGYQRAGVLAALFNSVALLVIALWIAVEAVGRLRHPQTVATGTMMVVAAAGVVMNGAIALALWRGSRDVNMRSVMVHMLGDTLSTAAVIAGGAAILWTGLSWIDPVLSLLIAALIFLSSLSIVRETTHILLEGAPAGISVAEVRGAMREVAGVEDVHDLHVWSLGSETHALAAHIRVGELSLAESQVILLDVQKQLGDRFHIHHTTIQFETGVACVAAEGCAMTGPAAAGGGAGHAHHHHHHGFGGHHH